jgi:aspartyl-tRNA(Asn)/glutamyl-tRNA(Gln) amidotransferase subunit B
LLARNIKITSETRHWDEQRKITKIARTKEEEQDYRYFPEPDIPVIVLDSEFSFHVSKLIPELPDQRLSRFLSDYDLSNHVANILINSKKLADFFETVVKIYASPIEIGNWIVNDLLGLMGGEETISMDSLKIQPKHIAELARLVDENKINRTTAKQFLTNMFQTGETPSELLSKSDLSRIDDENLIEKTVEQVFKSEESAVSDARLNPSAINFLVGKVMQSTKGRADPKTVTQLVRQKLESKIS